MNPSSIPLQGLAVTSLLVSLCIAVFLPLRPLLRRAIGSQWLCLLWLALLARLLMPLPLESRLGLVHDHQKPAVIPAAPMPETKTMVKVSVANTAIEPSAHVQLPATAPAASVIKPAVNWLDMLQVAWLVGVAVNLAILAWQYMRNRKLASTAQPARDARLLEIFRSIPESLRRGVELKIAPAVEVPTQAGIFRKEIWMPAEWPAHFSDEELRNVLLHELGHARRGDLAVQWLFAIAQCLHWFNPVVWFAARAARLDREMACDEWVLARNGNSESAYGEALMKAVRLLRGPLRANPAGVAMAASRGSIYARIAGIGAFRHRPAWRGALAALCIVGALVAATTSRVVAEPKADAQETPAAAATPAPASAAPESTPAVKITLSAKVFEISEAGAKKLGLTEFAVGTSNASTTVMKPEAAAALVKQLNDRRVAYILAEPVLTAKSGQRAVIENVTEFRYPTTFVADKNKPSAVIPSEFETRNIGTTFEMEARLENGSIDLMLVPQLVEFLGYTGVSGTMLPAPAGKGDNALNLPWPKDVAFTPIFSTRKISTSATMRPGDSVVVGGLKSLRKDGTLFYALVTATVDGGSAQTPTQPAGLSMDGAQHYAGAPDNAPFPDKPMSAQIAGVSIQTVFLSLPEAKWKKLCADNADFREFTGKLKDLDSEKPDQAGFEKMLLLEKEGTWKIPDNDVVLLAKIPGVQLARMLKTLNDSAGGDMLSAPSVQTRNKQEAQIEVIREVRYPTEWEENTDPKPIATKDASGKTVMVKPPRFTPTAFEEKDAGVKLKVLPRIEDDGRISLILTPAIVSWLGFIGEKNGTKYLSHNTPHDPDFPKGAAFSSTTSQLADKTDIDETLLLGGVHLEWGGKDAKDTTRRVHLIFVTPKLTNLDTQPKAAEPTPTPAPTPRDAPSLPYGTPVKGKPGFVTSPFTPDNDPVDVRGFPPNTEVKDPYSGKIFLVP